MKTRENIFKEIESERVKQDSKWGEQNHTPLEWLSILMEEVGEVSKEILEVHFKYPNKVSLEDYRKELVQVAAVAVAMLESYDRNKV